jgi:hypothetical protein
VESLPGIYFVGLHFLYAMTSATLMGVGIASRVPLTETLANARPRPNQGCPSRDDCNPLMPARTEVEGVGIHD